MNELGGEARAFLVKARGAHDARPGAKERVRAGLAAALAAPGSAQGGAGDATASRGARGAWAGAIKVAGVVAVLGAGVLFVRAHRTPATLPEPVTRSIATALSPSPSPAPPAAPAIEEAPPPSATPAPPLAAPTPRTVLAAPSARAPDSDGSVAAEVALLRRVSASLRAGDPTTALAGVAEHARRFPNGALAEERDMERIVALCALGRRDEASRATERFSRAYPSSSHEARIHAACAPPDASGVAP